MSNKLILQLAFQSIGVVYGDLGTSPLYVFSSTFYHGSISNTDDVLGALSLIIYTMILIPLVKYVFIVLQANDNGEGDQPFPMVFLFSFLFFPPSTLNSSKLSFCWFGLLHPDVWQRTRLSKEWKRLWQICSVKLESNLTDITSAYGEQWCLVGREKKLHLASTCDDISFYVFSGYFGGRWYICLVLTHMPACKSEAFS